MLRFLSGCCLLGLLVACEGNGRPSKPIDDQSVDTLAFGDSLRSDTIPDYPQQLSAFDDLIKAEADSIGWDWRLLAAIIYQESRFKPNLESSRGAYGLMQLMPITMERYGVDRESPIEKHLEAGGKLLLRIDQKLPESITDSVERHKFTLAAYNAGLGKVLEARNKARQCGKDPDLWTDQVENHINKQTYYFVREVLERYSYYQIITE